MFLIAEVLVLPWAFFIAALRMMPGKPGHPIRALAMLYVDIFRGMPAVIVIYLIAFGFPIANLPIVGQMSSFALCTVALVLVYGAYVSEISVPVFKASTGAQTAAARSLGLSHLQSLRYVVAPQAIRSMIPPLLNDFIGLQKDTSLISFVGVLDAFNQARIIASNSFNLSAVTGVGLFFIVVTIPMAQTRRSPKRSQRAPYPGDPLMPPLLTLSGVEKSFRRTHVLRGVDLSVNEHQVISLIGPSGCGKSTLLRCVNALEDIDAGEIRLDGDLVSASAWT